MPPTIDRHRLLLHTGFFPPFFLPLYSPNLQQGAQQQQSQHWDLRAFEGVCVGVCMCIVQQPQHCNLNFLISGLGRTCWVIMGTLVKMTKMAVKAILK